MLAVKSSSEYELSETNFERYNKHIVTSDIQIDFKSYLLDLWSGNGFSFLSDWLPAQFLLIFIAER